MSKKRILFLGETYRADAITWINGLKEFGDFEIVTWELKSSSTGFDRIKRLLELTKTFLTIRSIAKKFNPDMVIAERTTSYGFLAALSGIHPVAIAQQGITDLWPHNSPLYVFKKILQDYAFRKADLIHAWGKVMTDHIEKSNVDMNKVVEMPKGIDLQSFTFNDQHELMTINAIVTRSLEPEYKHEVILKAFAILKKKNIPFTLRIVGDGSLSKCLHKLAIELNIEKEVLFKGRVTNERIAELLHISNFYISMPITEGVSASLFEAMACGCFPIVTDLPGNKCWITNHENGILIPSKNYTLLAEEIIACFERDMWRKAVVHKNRKFIEEQANYAVNMKKIARIYHELINKKNSSK